MVKSTNLYNHEQKNTLVSLGTPTGLEDHRKQVWWMTEEFLPSWPDEEHTPGGRRTVSLPKSSIKRRLHQSKLQRVYHKMYAIGKPQTQEDQIRVFD